MRTVIVRVTTERMPIMDAIERYLSGKNSVGKSLGITHAISKGQTDFVSACEPC